MIGTLFNTFYFINGYKEGVCSVASKRIDNARSVGGDWTGEAGRRAAFNYLSWRNAQPSIWLKIMPPFSLIDMPVMLIKG